MSTDRNETLELLEWDTSFFGFRIARVKGEALGDMKQMDAWCRENDIACVYYLARSDDSRGAAKAEDNGFHLVDVRMTYQRETGMIIWPEGKLPEIRVFTAADMPALMAMAGSRFQDTRFYHDPQFPREKCDGLYRKWIEASCEGYAQIVLVSTDGGKANGFITCHVDDKTKMGKIGLLAVDEGSTSRHVGTSLVLRALEAFADKGMARVEVVTQGRNIGSQRLYQRCGFLSASCGLHFHKWYRPAGGNRG